MAGNMLRRLFLLLLSLEVCLAEITVNVSPEVDVIKGQTARLPCNFKTADSSPSIKVQWIMRHGAEDRTRVAYSSFSGSGVDKGTQFEGRMSMEADKTLVISQTKVEDERIFICQVSAGPDGIREAETKLKIFNAPEKPVVTANSQVISVGDFSSEIATCISRNAHPEPRLIWFKDSLPVPEGIASKGSSYVVPKVVKESTGLSTVSSTLYLKPKKEDAKSVFHCTVEYFMPDQKIEEKSSDNFNITLHYPAENVMFTLLNKEPIKEGDDIHMKCETDGNPQPQFEFYHNDTKIPNETGLLVLKNVIRSSSGTYKCEAFDFDSVIDDLIKNISIVVHYLDPVSILPVGPLILSKGDALDLLCRTMSSDHYSLVWIKDGKTLSQTGSYVQQSVTFADAGEYLCEGSALSVPGLKSRANITVAVRGKPEIEAPMKGEVKMVGEKVTLSCSAHGYPSPQFIWIPSGKESVKLEGPKTISTVTLPATTAVLKDGVTCEAKNEHGSVSQKFEVEIKSENSINPNNEGRAENQQEGSSGVVIAVVICVLLLLVLVASIYFLKKNGKNCRGAKDKQDPAYVKNDVESGPNPPENSKGLLQGQKTEEEGGSSEKQKMRQ